MGDFPKNVGLFPKNVGLFPKNVGVFFRQSDLLIYTLVGACPKTQKKGRVFSLLEENSAFNLFLHLAVFRVNEARFGGAGTMPKSVCPAYTTFITAVAKRLSPPSSSSSQ